MPFIVTVFHGTISSEEQYVMHYKSGLEAFAISVVGLLIASSERALSKTKYWWPKGGLGLD